MTLVSMDVSYWHLYKVESSCSGAHHCTVLFSWESFHLHVISWIQYFWGFDLWFLSKSLFWWFLYCSSFFYSLGKSGQQESSWEGSVSSSTGLNPFASGIDRYVNRARWVSRDLERSCLIVFTTQSILPLPKGTGGWMWREWNHRYLHIS